MEIQLAQVIFQIINFSVVLGALTYLLYKPIIKMLEERSTKISEAQKEAENTLAEKAKLDEMKKKIKRDADKEAAEIVETAHQTASEQADRFVKKSKEQAEADKSKLMDAWENEKKNYLVQMKKAFAQSVIAVSEKVIGAEIDAKQHAKLIDQELEELIKSI